MTLRYAFTRLLVQDVAASYRFYRDVLGLEPAFEGEDSVYAEFKTGEVTLALFDRGAMAQAIGSAGQTAQAEGQDRVALIFMVEHVDAEVEALRTKGVHFEREPHDQAEWGGRVAHFRDPDGTLIELYQSLPSARQEAAGDH